MLSALLLLALQNSFVERPQVEVLFDGAQIHDLGFGRKLALSDDMLFIRSNRPEPNGLSNSLGGGAPGAFHIFNRSGQDFVRTQLLSHPEPRHSLDFGTFLEAEGERLVITDSRATDNGVPIFFGRAYIYEREAGAYVLAQTILSTYAVNSTLGFGACGDLDGNRLVLAEPGNPGIGAPNNGIIRVFDHDGQRFVETARVTSPPALAAIPNGPATPLIGAMAMDGDTLMMGSVRLRVLVWEKNPMGTWEFKQVIEPPLYAFPAIGSFPLGLTLDGDWAVSGHVADLSSGQKGRVEVFYRNPTTSLWAHHQTLRASDGLATSPSGADDFGRAVSMVDGRIIVGAAITRNAFGVLAGAAYTFVLAQDGFWRPASVLRTDRSKSAMPGVGPAVNSGPGAGANVAVADGIALVYSPADYSTDSSIRESSTTVFELPIGQPTCDGRPNSVAATGARMELLGRPFASYEAWTINGLALPPATAVLPLMGTMPGSSTVSQGQLCLGGTIFRLGSAFGLSDHTGRFSESFESADGLVEPDVLAGSTWQFQLWYRDVNPSLGSNFSSSIQLTFR